MADGPIVPSQLATINLGATSISQTGSLTVNTSATAVFTSTKDGTSVIVFNNGLLTAFLGNSNVTASAGANQGMPLLMQNYSPSIILKNGDSLWAITATGSTTLNGIVLVPGP